MVKKFILATVILMGCVTVSLARTYYLPDYQRTFIYGGRTEQNNGTHTPPSCSTYGYYSESTRPTNAECQSVSFPGLKCYSCKCSNIYTYDSSNCYGDYEPSGKACGNKYTNCVCDKAKYSYTTSSCGYTLSGASCSDENGKHYAECVNPCEGLVDNKTDFGCEKYYNECPSKCEIGTPDPCERLTDNETEYGCDKYYDECPSKCEVGKTCKPNDCSGYTLSSCPWMGNCKKCTIGCGNNTSKYSLISCSDGYKAYNNTCLCIYGIEDECSYSSFSYPYSKKYGLQNIRYSWEGDGFFALEEEYGLKCVNAGEDIGEICTINCPSGYGLLVPPLGEEYSKCISCTVKNISEYERAKNSCERVILDSNFDGQQADLESNSMGGCSFSTNASALEGGHCSYAGKPVHVTANSNLNNLNFINLRLVPRDTISDITLTGTPFRVYTTRKSSKSPYKDDFIYIRNLNINSPLSGLVSYDEFFSLYGNTILENINLTSTSDGGYCMIGKGTTCNISVKNSSFIQKGQEGSACMNVNPLIEGEVNFLGWAYDACNYNLAENSVLNLSIKRRQGNFNLETNATVNIKTEENYSYKIYLKRLARFNINTENVTIGVIHVEKDAMIMIPSGLYRAEKDTNVSYKNTSPLKNFVEEYLLRIGDYDESVFPK